MWTYPKGLNRQYIQPKRRRRYIPSAPPVDITAPISFSNTIVFNQIVSERNIRNRAFNQTLSFIPTLVLRQTLSRSFIDILVFNQHVHLEVLLSTILTTIKDCKLIGLRDDIVFRECAGFILTHHPRRNYLDATQTIVFTSIATGTLANIIPRSLTNIIVFSESINSSYRINDNLTFSEILSSIHSVTSTQSSTQTLTFSQTLTRTLKHTISKSLSQTLIFTDSNTRNRVRILNQLLNDILTFDDTELLNVIRSLHSTQNIKFYDPYMNIRNPFAAKTETINPDLTIDLGQSDDTAGDNNILIPVVRVIKVQKLMTLVGRSAITLPLPEWGDAQTGRNAVNYRRAMNGKVYTYVKTTDRKLLKYVFKIGRRKSSELRQFISSNLTNPIYITDYDRGELWISKLVENPVAFNFEGSSRTEYGRISVELQFEGVRLQ